MTLFGIEDNRITSKMTRNIGYIWRMMDNKIENVLQKKLRLPASDSDTASFIV